MDLLESEYLKWLKKLIEQRESGKYSALLNWLYEQDFYSRLPNDDNRGADGELLREEYGIQLDRPCSMLEMLIALANRINYFLQDLGEGPKTKAYFWELIRNLELEPDDQEHNHLVIVRFLERKYERNGKGGLFPLRHYTKDQRGVEIWYQMMSYFNDAS